MYAVVRTGGRQYRVQEGRAIKLGRLAGNPGDSIELGEVLLLADGDNVTVGAPTVAGARVVGTIREQGRDRKVIVFRYKAKTRARKKTGHRQEFTRVMIDDILGAGEQPKVKQSRAAGEPEAEADTAPVEAAAAEPAAEKPKRTRRKAE